MADRAYLYSDDRPDAWSRPQDGYFDSRWTIPLAWFFFFEPGDVRLIDVDHGGAGWQEVRLSAVKDSALEVFERRKHLLISIIDRRLSDDAVEKFLMTVGGRPGRYLLMDPDEVLGGINCGFADDREHAERLSHILALIGDRSCSAEAAREATGPYVKDLSPDPDQCEVQILGYTYW